MKNKFWRAYLLMIVLPTAVYVSLWYFHSYLEFYLRKFMTSQNINNFDLVISWMLVLVLFISILYINKKYVKYKNEKSIMFITKILWFLFLLFVNIMWILGYILT